MPLPIEDIELLEQTFAHPTVVDNQLVYVIPRWLVNMRAESEATTPPLS